MGGRGGIDVLLGLMDEAFRGRGIEESNESQALLANLASVDDAAWRSLPPGATRTIESIVLHVGSCKVMYDDYAFGAGTLQWGTPGAEPWGCDGPGPRADVMEWLGAAHERLAGHVAALGDDADLDTTRMTNWGSGPPDSLDRRLDDHPRCLPFGRDQSPPQLAGRR